jgi:hypothetical protein
MRVDLDFTPAGQLHRVPQPIDVGQQPDLHKDTAPELPPPITATRLPLKSVDQAARLLSRDQTFGALAVDDVDVVLVDVLLERRGQLESVGVRHGDQVLDRQRIEDLAAEALSEDTGADALACGVDRCRRPGRTAADDEDVEGGLPPILSAARRSALASSRAAICSTLIRPCSKGSPFRKTTGTDITWRAATSSWKSAPSIATCRILGFRTLIRFKACTVSGQLWQDSDMKVSKRYSPSRARTCSTISGSTFGGWPLVARRSTARLAEFSALAEHIVEIRRARKGKVMTSIGRRA